MLMSVSTCRSTVADTAPAVGSTISTPAIAALASRLMPSRGRLARVRGSREAALDGAQLDAPVGALERPPAAAR